MVGEYESALHNFFDYQLIFSQPSRDLNQAIGQACFDFLESVRAYEAATMAGAGQAIALETVSANLDGILARIHGFPDQLTAGLKAGLQLLSKVSANYLAVAKPSAFSRLFGRETLYLSMIRE